MVVGEGSRVVEDDFDDCQLIECIEQFEEVYRREAEKVRGKQVNEIRNIEVYRKKVVYWLPLPRIVNQQTKKRVQVGRTHPTSVCQTQKMKKMRTMMRMMKIMKTRAKVMKKILMTKMMVEVEMEILTKKTTL